MTKTIPLAFPLPLSGGQYLSHVNIQLPTAQSFARHGEPFTIRAVDGSVVIDFNNDAMLGVAF